MRRIAFWVLLAPLIFCATAGSLLGLAELAFSRLLPEPADSISVEIAALVVLVLAYTTGALAVGLVWRRVRSHGVGLHPSPGRAAGQALAADR